MFKFLSGYKTYFVCAVACIYAASGYSSGHLTFDQAFQVVLAALGAAGFRSAMSSNA